MDITIRELFDLGGRVALVTGAAKGIGEGIADNLARAGASVAVADIDVEAARATAKDLSASGCQATAIEADLSDEDSIEAMIAATVGAYGRLDIVVNNAAVYPMSPVAELTTDLWDRVLSVNLRGAFLVTRSALPHLRAAAPGARIVNISSINTAKSYVGMPHYDASKGGLEAFTRSCALEFAAAGITANVVAPGAVKTPGSLAVRSQLARERGEKTTDAVDAEFASRIPAGDWASPDEIGRAVLLLTSRAADYITGQTLYVDGGLSLTI